MSISNFLGNVSLASVFSLADALIFLSILVSYNSSGFETSGSGFDAVESGFEADGSGFITLFGFCLVLFVIFDFGI